MKRSRTFFTEEEKKVIEDKIKKIEKTTIGEIAVMVVDASDDYPDAAVTGSIFFSSIISLFITVQWLHSSVWLFILAGIVLIFPLRLLLGIFPQLTTPFIGTKRRESAVRKRALAAFYEKGLHRTKQNTGVLFFISLLEHKIWVLADSGIYKKIAQETLNRFAAEVSFGIKQDTTCKSLCNAIEETGRILAEHFPVTIDDTNELSDSIITE